MTLDVLLLHGCGGSVRSTFARTGWIAAIGAAGRCAIAPDLPGHGAHASTDPQDYADLAGSVERGLPAGTLDAVGFSLGAKIVLELALRQPERFHKWCSEASATMCSVPKSSHPWPPRRWKPQVRAAAHPAVAPMLQRWEPDLNDARAVAAVLRRPPNPQFSPERLSQLSIPVLIVNGSEDPVGKKGDRLARSLRHMRCETVPGVDHFGLPGDAAFQRLALDFLRLKETK